MRSKYNMLKDLSAAKFRRISGVHPETFKKMVKILKICKKKQCLRGGPKGKLTLENQLLLHLEYLRENRTFAHICVNYGVSESTAWRVQRWVEDTLIHSGEFNLPGKKVLCESNEIKTVLVDVSECPIERPKKKKKKLEEQKKPSKAILLWEKEDPHHQIANSY